LHINKSIIRFRQLEDNKSLFHRIYSLEYNKNALKYDKNGNKQNSTLEVVEFSERIFQLLESVNIRYSVI
jgi:hypothetical protein